MGGIERAASRLRQPEYTGENRCLPCTGANLAIAAVLGLVAGAAVTAATRPAFGAAAGGGLVLAGAALIYLRGYLVPGTPALTKRYFPDWLLRAFDKERPSAPAAGGGEDVDVESFLLELGALEERPDGDLELNPEFASEWHERVEAARENGEGREALAEVVGVDPDRLDFVDFGQAFVATVEGRRIGRWESRGAFLADAAAGRLLAERYPRWEGTDPAARGEVLAGLRLFLERCPECEGPVRFGQEVVESCCRNYDVIAVTCDDCESRLFEVEAGDLAGDESAAA